MAVANAQVPVSILAEVVAGKAPSLEPLTIGQVEQMMAHGILIKGAPIELIDGLLVRKDRSTRGGDPITHHPKHAGCLVYFQSIWGLFDPHGCHLRSHLPVALSETRAPEPDFAVARGGRLSYRGRHPGPDDVIVVGEVADSSLDYDRTIKQRLNATAGIELYWIVNVIEVYEQRHASRKLPLTARRSKRAKHRPSTARQVDAETCGGRHSRLTPLDKRRAGAAITTGRGASSIGCSRE